MPLEQFPDFAFRHKKTENQGIRIRRPYEGALARVSPRDRDFIMNVVQNRTNDPSYEMLRKCALAVLKGDNGDDPKAADLLYPGFDITIAPKGPSIEAILYNPPKQAFTNGSIEQARRKLLFDVVRDIIFVRNFVSETFDSERITDDVYRMIDHSGLFRSTPEKEPTPSRLVCWGGHSINGEEYDYAKKFGFYASQLGSEIITGCGPGIMKAPMKGAVLGHYRQGIIGQRLNIGYTEPGIISSESPNPVVNHLVIFPDIEKRLEAFVRSAHGIAVFPGGAGTAEEIMYILSILTHPKNKEVYFPVIFTGPASSAPYFDAIDNFLRLTLGEQALFRRTRMVAKDPAHDEKNAEETAYLMAGAAERVKILRKKQNDDVQFNRNLYIPDYLQLKFDPTHEAMAALKLVQMEDKSLLASNLRSAFSGIVAGNIKPDGVARVEKQGPYDLYGDSKLIGELDNLLLKFAVQGRMKIDPDKYRPVHRCNPNK